MSVQGNVPPHRRGPWSQSEDHLLMELVSSSGALNWVRISGIIGSRTPKQCRERYHQNLKPTLNHEPISPAEGIIIERLVAQYGKRWAEIARHLHGRSDNAVKNWWNGSQNRRKRIDKRKASHHHPAAYHDKANMVYAADMTAIPRSLPFPHANRPLPPPLDPQSLHAHDRGQRIDTSLPSPTVYSPDSEDFSSPLSDSFAQYATSNYSPGVLMNLSPASLRLPPIQLPEYARGSPTTPSPTGQTLPPLSDVTSPLFTRSPRYSDANVSPDMHHASYHTKLSPIAMPMMALRPHLPTAPNSPVVGNQPLMANGRPRSSGYNASLSSSDHGSPITANTCRVCPTSECSTPRLSQYGVLSSASGSDSSSFSFLSRRSEESLQQVAAKTGKIDVSSLLT